MGIAYLDGKRLTKAVVAAAQRVLDVQERLNNINVFPVADGDTGTNMAMTLKWVADGAINFGESSLDSLSACLAQSALEGARGNSGAILAQFFQGLADGFQGSRQVGVDGFAASAEKAVDYAEQAIEHPVEGTILTVMRAWSDHLQQIRHKAGDFLSLIEASCAAAMIALQETPAKLRVLAKAGVVDAGAQGFVNMLEGVVTFMKTGEINWDATPLDRSTALARAKGTGDEIRFRFCSECLLYGNDLDAKAVRRSIADLGDSMIVAGNPRTIKIHIHTDDPEELFRRVAAFGTVSNRKTEDMRAQQANHFASHEPGIALIADSSCDLPARWLIQHGVRVIPVQVTFGSKTYEDRVTITPEEVYRLMAEHDHPPRTSQPVPAAFRKAYNMAAENHDQALAIYVASSLSGTYQAGLAAAREVAGLHIEVIDSKSVAGAAGLLVKVAAEAIAEGCNLEQVRDRVLNARRYAKIFVSLPSLDHLVRGGRIGKMRGWLARLLHLVPILSFDENGKVFGAAKTRPGQASWRKVVALVVKQARGLQGLRFLVCHAAAPEAAAFMAQALQTRFGLEQVDVLQVSPTVGAHVGLGVAAIAMIGFPHGDAP